MRVQLRAPNESICNCFRRIDRRAKEKRLKKDAGRTRWSQYFRSMKGGSSPGRHDKLLDKDELKIDLDSFDHGKNEIGDWERCSSQTLL